MKLKYYLHRLIVVLICLTAFSARSLTAQTTQHETGNSVTNSNDQSIIFKVPEKFMPLKFSGFKGLVMLSAGKPAGIFITYPNEKESIEDLKNRAADACAKMFIGGEKIIDKNFWQVKIISSHQGDKGETAEMRIYEIKDSLLTQVVIYEREWKGLTFIYGYFAMRPAKAEKSKYKDYWLNDEGRGVDEFEKFWKSFPVQ